MLSGGGSAVRGGCCPGSDIINTPSPHGQTNASENTTLPQISFVDGKKNNGSCLANDYVLNMLCEHELRIIRKKEIT